MSPPDNKAHYIQHGLHGPGTNHVTKTFPPSTWLPPWHHWKGNLPSVKVSLPHARKGGPATLQVRTIWNHSRRTHAFDSSILLHRRHKLIPWGRCVRQRLRLSKANSSSILKRLQTLDTVIINNYLLIKPLPASAANLL